MERQGLLIGKVAAQSGLRRKALRGWTGKPSFAAAGRFAHPDLAAKANASC
jgi:hypothetical protein